MLPVALERMRSGLIVSCQAEEGDPFHRPEYVALFARAAEMGGAVGIRAREPENVRAIRQAVQLPIIGLTKSAFPDGSVLITPEFSDVDALIAAGSDIIAVDATHRIRPNGLDGPAFVRRLRERHPDLCILADISTFDEAIDAEKAGASAVAPTLAGYNPQAASSANGPNWLLLEQLVGACRVPVIMEGRVASAEDAAKGLRLGAFAVVVGTAITRPRVVVQSYVEAMRMERR